MAEIRIKEGESLDNALRRFKKQCARSGVIAEVRKREAYEKLLSNARRSPRRPVSASSNKRTVFCSTERIRFEKRALKKARFFPFYGS